MKVSLKRISPLPIIGRSDDQGPWVASWGVGDFGCVAPTIPEVVGRLVRYELSAGFREDGRHAETKRELLDRFPPPAASKGQSESPLGTYCIDNAERLGFSFHLAQEEVKVGYRLLTPSDLA